MRSVFQKTSPGGRAVLPLLMAIIAGAIGVAAPQARASESAAEFSLREWHGGDGLPDEVVHSVVQDARGYLWIATEGGVVRFNGIRFDPFMPPDNASGLDGVTSVGSRGVPAMVSHPEYGLLLAFGTGEIWQWTGSELRRAPVADLFSKSRIESWFVQADGALWANFLDGRIECLRNGRITKITLGHSLLAGRPLSFADDGEGGVWIAARAALYHFQTGDSTAASIELAPAVADFAHEEISIASSRRGKPWIIAGNILGRLDGGHIAAPLEMPRLLGSHFVYNMIEDRAGNLWVGTRSQGAYVVKSSGREYQQVPAAHRTVRSICEDTEGNIWLATNGGGLNRLQVKRFRLYDSSAGLEDDLTFTVAEDRSGAVWLANRDGGMIRVRDGRIFKNPPGWPVVSAGRVFPDNRDGGVWFTAGSGLFKTDASGEFYQRALDPAPFKNMRVLFVTRAGELWIGGDSGELGRLAADGSFAAFGDDSGFPARQRPGAIVEDASGRVIVGTNSGGLFRFDSESGRFISLRSPSAPSLVAVRSLLVDEDGALWIGTGGAGVFIITPAGQERQLRKENGLPDELISQMLFDDHGRVWFGSSHGIFSTERAQIADFVAGRINTIPTSTFGENEGLEHLTCLNGYQPHCWKTRDGTLWFTTRRGALAIDPEVLSANREPPAYIDSMIVDGETAKLPAGGAPIKIRSDARRIEFLFSALNLTAPERAAVRYRLEGFDSAWLPAGDTRKLVYPRLYPGTYRLEIDAADASGHWNSDAAPAPNATARDEADCALTVIVEPFWWQTVWFRIALVILIAALLTAVVRTWSYRRLRRRLERTEREASINRERTRIARDIHDELGASLTRISLLSQYTAADTTTPPQLAPAAAPPPQREADQRACLDEIYTATSSITRSINEIVWAIDARHDNLESVVSYLDSYAQRFLTVAKIRYRFLAPAQLPALTINSRVRHDLFLAFKEALNNCAKYSGATEVVVTVAIDARDFGITITDNGGGITPGAAPAGGGQGLSNLALRLASIGGHAAIYPAQNGGTEVAFALPLTTLAA